MSAPEGRAGFGRIAATLAVRDIARALAFYRDVLGLEVTFENGAPVSFVILKKDAAELHLQRVAEHTGAAFNVAHVLVDDARALHDRCVAAGAPIIKALRDHDHGLRAFVVADPDGNRLDIAQHLPT